MLGSEAKLVLYGFFEKVICDLKRRLNDVVRFQKIAECKQ